jgi:hypothetical protein
MIGIIGGATYCGMTVAASGEIGDGAHVEQGAAHGDGTYVGAHGELTSGAA